MKYSIRIVIVVSLTALLGVIVLFGFYYEINQSLDVEKQMEFVMPPEGSVNLFYLECAGQRSVIVLDNQTDHPIYARVHPANYWKDFKDAKIEFGLHLIDYRAPSTDSFKDISPRSDAVEPLREIPANSKVRYGIDLPEVQGEYIVRVPYMEDEEVARRIDDDFISKNKEAFARDITLWKEVRTGIIMNQRR